VKNISPENNIFTFTYRHLNYPHAPREPSEPSELIVGNCSKYLSRIPDLHIVRLPIKFKKINNDITVVVVLTSVTNNYYSGSLPSSDRVNLNYVYDPDSTLTGAELTISGAVIADSGTYQCRATNKHGSVTKQVRIDIQAGTTPGVVSG